MSLGKRRIRTTMVQLRPGQADVNGQGRHSRSRRRTAIAAILVSMLVACTVLVAGKGPPFPYRLGQRPDREIRVSVPEFQLKDLIHTNSLRLEAFDAVPPVLVNDPTPLVALRDELVDLMSEIGGVAGLADLHERDREVWNLDARAFESIRSAMDTAPRREDSTRALGRAFEPLIRDGVLGPNTLPRDLPPTSYYLIFDAGGNPSEAREVARDRVVPDRLTLADGVAAREFIAAFKSPELGQALFGLTAAKLKLLSTLLYRDDLTSQRREAARMAVRDVYRTYRASELLVARDQSINEEQLALLQLEHQKARSLLSSGDHLRRWCSLSVIVAALMAFFAIYLPRHHPRVVSSLRQLIGLAALMLGTLILMRLLASQFWNSEVVPITVCALLLAIAYSQEMALVSAFVLSVLTTLVVGGGIDQFLILMGGTSAGVLVLDQVRTRTKLIMVGGVAAAAYFVMTWAVGLLQNQPLEQIWSDAAWRSAWGLSAGFFLGGSLPFIESVFGIVTGISLLELGDINHPLLRELVQRAAGTYNHSVTVASIAETAAERIGADSLLVRVGAYYHDIGKMLKPNYFVENQVGPVSRHSRLAPGMSTLIIIGHVKDGVELARQHHLPDRIIDLIEQHHGTTLVEYFYHEAARRYGEDSEIQEAAFRYPGPKPRTKEAAVLMIADATESASRALSEPAPARLESLVEELVDKRLRDGQFDECGLTLREIAEIRKSLTKSLIGIYHGRIKYPTQRTA